MLHLVSLLLTLLNPPVGTACALSDLPSVDFATTGHKTRLRACIIEQTVWFTGVARLPKHVVVPGQQERVFGGLQLKGERVLSVVGVTHNYDLSLTPHDALDILSADAKTGIAVLKGISSFKTVAKSEDTISAGRVFFAIDHHRKLHRFSISSKGSGAFGYYWRGQIRLPIGTPIFNARGEWVSLSALPADRAQTYFLPKTSFDNVEFKSGGAQ